MIIDTAVDTTAHLGALKGPGVTIIGRYIARGLEHEEKVIKAAEAKAIAAAGLKLFLIYERQGHPHAASEGETDGAFARWYAGQVGAPDGAVIYYTVDYDAGPAELPGIVAAFTAFKAALGDRYQVGAYASGYVCGELYRQGLINRRWLTMSNGFRGTRPALYKGAYDLRQTLTRHVAGLSVDPSETRMPTTDIGAFVPFAAAAAAARVIAMAAAPKPAPAPAPFAGLVSRITGVIAQVVLWIAVFIR